MDLRDMECLLALWEHRSYTRAAEKLFMSQPALSRRIQHMSLELGVDLVDRSDGELHFTRAGMRYLDYCRDALQKNEEITQELSKMKSGDLLELRVANCYSGTNYLLPAIIDQLRLYPNTNFTFVKVRKNMDISRLLTQNEIDIAIGIRDEIEHYTNINSRTFLNMRYGFSVSALHPYYSKEYLTLTDLLDQKIMFFISPDVDYELRNQPNFVSKMLIEKGVPEDNISYVDDVVTMSSYSATGKYLIFTNFNAAAVRSSGGLLRVIPWNDIEFTAGDLMVAWRKNDPAADTFANTIINCDYHSFLAK